jgi:hypothetical protein
MPKKRLPDHKTLLSLFQEHSVAQIAEMFEVTEKAVIRKIAEARHKRIILNPAQEERYNQIKTWLSEGKNFGQIGRLLNISRGAAREYAIQHGLYSPLTGELLYGLPINCPQCVLKPLARGLCKNCYKRFWRRRVKKLVDYHNDKLLILNHSHFKVFYKSKSGYEIHTPPFDAPQISRPTELEKFLLDYLQREALAELDRAARQKAGELEQEEGEE